MDVPKALAKRRAWIEIQVGDKNRQITALEQARATLYGELEGINVAIAAFAAAEAQPTAEPKAPRRDIRAMVREWYALPRTFSPTPKLCAQAIGCRISQVEAALKAINGEAP